MAEYLDLYDRELRPTGEKWERNDSVPIPEGKFHYVVNILCRNKEGKLLITKRHPDKPYGGWWEISGGSVQAGEKPLDGTVRELFEETGLKAEPSELRYFGQIIRERSGCIHNFYYYEGDFSEKDIVLQEGETVDCRLVTPKEMEEMSERREFLDFSFNRLRAVFADLFFMATPHNHCASDAQSEISSE